MDTGLLRVFSSVAREGSVTRAAKTLHCVQSNVTARIRQLENDLEAQLFYRTKRGMVLTPEGRILFEYADRILNLTEEAEKVVRDSASARGPLVIGTIESTAAVRLPRILSSYRRNYPQVEITIRTGTTEELVNGVLSYKLDGAFVGGKVKHSEIEQQPLVSEEMVIVTEAKISSLQGLENPTLLVFRKGCSYRALLENWLHEAGILPYSTMEFGILDGILGCIAAGMGITMFPLSVIESLGYADKITCHRVSGTSLHVPTMFIRRKNAVVTKAMEAFLQTALTKEDLA